MEQELGRRICDFFYAMMLTASVMEKNDMNTLTKGYEALGGDLAILSTYGTKERTNRK